MLRGIEVGNGAGDLEDAVVGMGGEVEALDGTGEEETALLVEDSVLLNEKTGHLGIAMDTGTVLVTFRLTFTGSVTDEGAVFAVRCLGEI